MDHVLVIVPCGQAKVWDKCPDRGPTPARDAYVGAPFKVNREYAERFGSRWVILSAMYGFLTPETEIPGPYNMSFKKKSPDVVKMAVLRDQIRAEGLDQFDIVIGLGGKEYRRVLEEAFASGPVEVRFPFAGLRIGGAMQATKRAIRLGVMTPSD